LFSFFGTLQFPDIVIFLGGISLFQILFTFISLLFVSCVGILAGFELPLYIRILSEKEILKDAIGKAFFWDYVGALVISISLPIFFFSRFGLIKTSFLIGMINLVAAAMLFICSDIRNKKSLFYIGFLLAMGINIFGFVSGAKIELFLEEKQFGNREVIYHADSPYQRLTFVEADDKKISFYINGQRQFESGEWDAVYHESFIHPAMSLAEKRDNILVLGGGDGLALREILKYPDVKNVTLVDIDPVIIKAASDLDFMKALNNNAFFDPRAKVIIDDAFKFVEREGGKNKYDLIFVDFPDPTDDSLSRLYSKEFYVLLKAIFNGNTIVVIQSESYFGSIQKNILTTLESVGLEGVYYHPPEYDFFDQNFGFSMICSEKCPKDRFKDLFVSVPNRIFQQNKLSDIFSVVPVSKYSFAKTEINSIFHPTIINLVGDVFIDHYLQSRPFDEILKQIKTSPEASRERLLKEYFVLPAASI
jgi:spermidine synthase